jgi:hypothetical protein
VFADRSGTSMQQECDMDACDSVLTGDSLKGTVKGMAGAEAGC